MDNSVTVLVLLLEIKVEFLRLGDQELENFERPRLRSQMNQSVPIVPASLIQQELKHYVKVYAFRFLFEFVKLILYNFHFLLLEESKKSIENSLIINAFLDNPVEVLLDLKL